MKKCLALAIVVMFGLNMEACSIFSEHNTCVDPQKLEHKWLNSFILEQYYDQHGLNGHDYLAYPGFFAVNADSSYNVITSGVPHDGSWKIDTKNCLLVLDKGTVSERSFNILVLTSDSLVIQRNDAVNNVIYTQHYYR